MAGWIAFSVLIASFVTSVVLYYVAEQSRPAGEAQESEESLRKRRTLMWWSVSLAFLSFLLSALAVLAQVVGHYSDSLDFGEALKAGLKEIDKYFALNADQGYDKELKGAASELAIGLQVALASSFVLTSYISLVKFPQILVDETKEPLERRPRIGWIVLLVNFVLSGIVAAAMAAVYQPLITFVAMIAVVLAFEHLGHLELSGRSLHRNVTQLHNISRTVGALLNRYGAEEWRMLILEKISQGFSCIGSVRFWDMDSPTLEDIDIYIKEGKTPREACDLALETALTNAPNSGHKARAKRDPDVRNVLADALLANQGKSKVTFIAFSPPFSVVGDGDGTYPVFWPLAPSPYGELVNLAGCCYQLMLFDRLRTRLPDVQFHPFTFVAGDVPWAYVLQKDERPEKDFSDYAFYLVEGRKQDQGDYAIDVTASVSGLVPLETEKEDRRGVRADRRRLVYAIKRNLVAYQRKAVALAPSILTYILFKIHWEPATPAASEYWDGIRRDADDIDKDFSRTPQVQTNWDKHLQGDDIQDRVAQAFVQQFVMDQCAVGAKRVGLTLDQMNVLSEDQRLILRNI